MLMSSASSPSDKFKTYSLCSLHHYVSTGMGTQRPSVSPTAPPSFFNPSWDKEREGEREGEREAEILLQGIHLITETELIAS